MIDILLGLLSVLVLLLIVGTVYGMIKGYKYFKQFEWFESQLKTMTDIFNPTKK